MAEFKLERFKYNWRGDWAAGTEYKRDDVIRLGGKSYVCLVKHTASSIFASDLRSYRRFSLAMPEYFGSLGDLYLFAQQS